MSFVTCIQEHNMHHPSFHTCNEKHLQTKFKVTFENKEFKRAIHFNNVILNINEELICKNR